MENEQEDAPNPGVNRVMTDLGNKAQRLLRVDQIYSRKDRQVHFVKTTKPKARPDRFGKTALVVRRIISKQGMVASTEVDIKSEPLSTLMQDIFQGVEGLSLNKSPPMADPQLFFHAQPHLMARKEQEKQKQTPSQGLVNDIGTALRFVDEDFGSRMLDLNSLLEHAEITWDLLWVLFPPKQLLFAPRHGPLAQEQAMFLKSVPKYEQRQNGSHFLAVTGNLINHDGDDFGWGGLSLEIDQYEGARKINSLPVYPFDYHPEQHEVRKRLISRGRRFIGLVQDPVCQECTSFTATKLETLIDGTDKVVKVTAKGRVMVDPQAFKIYANMNELNKPYVYSADAINRYDNLNDDHYLVCPYWLNGFSFPRKQWVQLNVADLIDIAWNEDAFSKLAIADTRRRIIHGLVKAHRNNETAFDDIIENKGKGMVGLLTGSPGVGKTLTAEVVAEVTHRPLYIASGGELGADPEKVDTRLQTILEITRRWACVLLIDEADVFLSVRGKSVEQDTLVSIFLRRLEYFQGVLILTTNRKEEIDPAFQSRIHFTLHYPDLDEAKRTIIWKNFLDVIAQNTTLSALTDDDVEVLAKRPLNGRQIKNAASCAVSLAREEGQKLTLASISELLDVILG